MEAGNTSKESFEIDLSATAPSVVAKKHGGRRKMLLPIFVSTTFLLLAALVVLLVVDPLNKNQSCGQATLSPSPSPPYSSTQAVPTVGITSPTTSTSFLPSASTSSSPSTSTPSSVDTVSPTSSQSKTSSISASSSETPTASLSNLASPSHSASRIGDSPSISPQATLSTVVCHCANGTCYQDTCLCQWGFFGSLCEFQCPNRCTSPNNGVCANTGACLCQPGFTGEACNFSSTQLVVALRPDISCLSWVNTTTLENVLSVVSSDIAKKKEVSSLPPTFRVIGCVWEQSVICTLQVEGTTTAGIDAAVSHIKSVALNNDVRLTKAGLAALLSATDSSWTPIAAECSRGCNGNGKCLKTGACQCFPGFKGADCSQVTSFEQCTDNCNGNGLCFSGICQCNEGWTGALCDVLIIACAGNCAGHGTCNTTSGICTCEFGFAGEDCSTVLCTEGCGEHGTCENGICVCEVGYTGASCETSFCTYSCGNGVCVNHTCVCNIGWNGQYCDTVGCPYNCSLHGQCERRNGTSYACECDPGFQGLGCQAALEMNCTNGIDDDGDGVTDCDDPDCCDTFHCRSVGTCVVVPSALDILISSAPTVKNQTVTAEIDLTSQLHVLLDTTQFNTSVEFFAEERLSLARGTVTDLKGVGLLGVVVTIGGHPEHGYTTTRKDGGFDIVVEGGGFVNLQFQRLQFMQTQRTQLIEARTVHLFSNVALLPVSSRATLLAANVTQSNSTLQVAVADTVTDKDGTRTARLVFSTNNTATVHSTNGSAVAVDEPVVRITEFTVGDAGPSAMPAELPVSSGYTYAVEISLDQATVDGSTDVVFGDLVPFYVENFLGFPVGSSVPVGALNRTQGVWLPENDGRVIKIVNVTLVDGVRTAVLELRANVTLLEKDSPDANDAIIQAEFADEGQDISAEVSFDPVTGLESSTIDELEKALNITLQEKQLLAETYEIGQELWRVLVPHATPWDCNWPFGPPPDGCSPLRCEIPIELPKGEDNQPDPSCDSDDSTIQPTTQTLKERAEVAGAPFNLAYTSNRMPAYQAPIEIPTTSSNPPQSLRSARVKLLVAGRVITRSFDTVTPNLVAQFHWDRRDLLGRTIFARTPYQAHIEYSYPLTYYPVRSSFINSFSRVGTNVALNRGVQTDRNVVVTDVVEGEVPASRDVTNELNMGGWSFTCHHRFDVANSELHFGDGRVQQFPQSKGFVETILGGRGRRQESCVTCGLDPQSKLFAPVAVAVHSDKSTFVGDKNVIYRISQNKTVQIAYQFASDAIPSSLYYLAVHPLWGDLVVSIPDHRRVYRLLSNQTLEPIIGTGEFCYPAQADVDRGLPVCGEGGLALHAKLLHPRGVVVLRDGDIYFADGSRILHVTPDGRIGSFVGFAATSATGVPAFRPNVAVNRAQLIAPTYLATNPSGDQLYFIDSGSSLIYSIDWRSRLIVIAGYPPNSVFPEANSENDNTNALRTPLRGPTGLAVTPNSEIVFAEVDMANGIHRLRKVSARGRLQTLSGAPRTTVWCPSSSTQSCDGVLNRQSPTLAVFRVPVDVAVLGNKIVVADAGNFAVRTVGLASTLQSGTNFVVPELGTTLLHVFDAYGVHISTRSTQSAEPLLSFFYDDNGLLSKIISSRGDNTTLIRSPNDQSVSVIITNGEVTLLEYNHEKMVSRVEYPGKNTARTYDYIPASGLMRQQVDEVGRTHSYSFDSVGRLTQSTSSLGANTQLMRSDLAKDPAHAVTMLLPEMQREIFKHTMLESGSSESVLVDDADGKTATTTHPDGSWTKVMPDGSKTHVVVGSHPIWGEQVQVPVRQTMILPSGRTLVLAHSYVVTPNPVMDPLQVQSLQKISTINGKPWASSVRDYTNAHLTEYIGDMPSRKLSYNTLGLVVHEQVLSTNLLPVQSEYSSTGRLLRTWRGNASTTFEYDPQGRLTRWVTSANETKSFDYTTNANGTQTRTMHYQSGRKVKATFDSDGRLRSVVMPSGVVHRLAYADKAADIGDTYIDPLGRVRVDKLRKDGKMKATVLPSGRTMRNIYDTQGRLIQDFDDVSSTWTSYVPGTKTVSKLLRTIVDRPTITVELSFDGKLQLGARTSYDVRGLTSEVALEYDSNWRLVKTTTKVDSVPTWTSTTTYNSVGLRTQVDGFSVSISPDGLSTTYRKMGSWSSGIQTITSTTSTTESRLTFCQSSSTPCFKEQLAYPAGGSFVVGWNHTFAAFLGLDNQAVKFVFDIDGQLTQVIRNDQVTEEYKFDVNGNRIWWKTPNGEHIAAYSSDDSTFEVDGVAFTTDADGALRACGDFKFEFTTQGELILAEHGQEETAISYSYDGLGRRVYRRTKAVTTIFMYHSLDAFHRVTDILEIMLDETTHKTSKQLTHVTYDNHGRVLYLNRGSSRFLVLTDFVGSPLAVVDEGTQQVVLTRTYDAFGCVIDSAGDFDLPFGFASGLIDPDTGLVHFYRRDYDPKLGRFISKDPLLFDSLSTNLYSYVFNDPINFRDPLGLFCMGYVLSTALAVGAEICIDKSWKTSLCVKGGVGIPTGPTVNFEDKPKGNSMQAYANGNVEFATPFGSVGAEVGANYDFAPEWFAKRDKCKPRWHADAKVSAELATDWDMLDNGSKKTNNKGKSKMFKFSASGQAAVEVCVGNGGS